MSLLHKYYSLRAESGNFDRRIWFRQIIVDRKIYLSTHDQLDDPSEFSPQLEFDEPTEEFIRNLPRLKEGLLRQVCASGLSDNEFLEAKNAIDQADYARILFDKECTSAVIESLLSAVKRQVRIYSFSNSPFRNVEDLWRRYGDDHKGVRIDFDFDRITSLLGNELIGGEVSYKPKGSRHAVIPFESGGVLESFAGALLLQKEDDWADQEEWRLIRTSCNESPYFDLPRESILQVILGSRINDNDEAFVREVVREAPDKISIIPEGKEQFVLCSSGPGL